LKSADDFASINSRLKEIEAEKLPKAEMPEVQPSYVGWPYVVTVDTAPSEYVAPAYDAC
jgi:hypothetical protein